MSPVSDAEIYRRELERVLGGRGFTSAGRLSQFLRYVVEETLAGRGDHIKEYSIGVSVYGKSTDYDPKIDATVRGEASRLRSRLFEYYSGEGSENPLRIEIPKGCYVPQFRPAPSTHLQSQDHATTSELVRKQVGQSPKSAEKWVQRRLSILLAACGLAAAVFWFYYHQQPPAWNGHVDSIAVLPFKPLAHLPVESDKTLGLVLADAVISRIGALDGILVRPTSAIRRYEDAAQDPIAAARTLKVAAVLDGGFQRFGDRIRVTAQLLRVEDGKHVWTGHFDERLSDMFAVQDAIAEQLAGALHVQLQRQEYDLAKNANELLTPERVGLYARARYHLLRYSPEDVTKAVGAFERLTIAVPNFANGYVGLALAYGMQPDFGQGTYREACPKVKVAVDKALDLAPGLPDAVAALGTWQFHCEENYAAAEQSFNRAIRSNPAQIEVYLLYGGLLDATGRHEKAIEVKRRAISIDPTSITAHMFMSLSYYNLRRYDEAMEWIHKAIDLDPQNSVLHFHAAAIQYASGNYEGWAVSVSRAAHLFDGTPEQFTTAYKHGGRLAVFRAVLAATKDPCGKLPLFGAFLHSQLGDNNQAFSCLTRAREEHDGSIHYLRVNPAWDRLRDDPRFMAMLSRTGLK
jgi:TolB-like protein